MPECRTLARRTPDDRAIAALAARQHGVVGAAQLHALGLSARAVRARAERGRLHRLHAGVYAVGHPSVTREGRWLAAVMACGPRAVLSHRAAAALWGLRPPVAAWPEVTIPAGSGRRRSQVRVVRVRHLHPEDADRHEGIPCTSVARTLVDLAASESPGRLAGACDRAETLRLLDVTALHAALDRASPKRGTARLRALLRERWEPSFTRQELEARFLALCRDAHLPVPRVNTHVTVAGELREVDFCWPEQRLIVETDGHRDHGGRTAFENDRRRDQELVAGGWRVVRFTWHQLTTEPRRTLAVLRRLLSP